MSSVALARAGRSGAEMRLGLGELLGWLPVCLGQIPHGLVQGSDCDSPPDKSSAPGFPSQPLFLHIPAARHDTRASFLSTSSMEQVLPTQHSFLCCVFSVFYPLTHSLTPVRLVSLMHYHQPGARG